jgi:hypothetical protein
MAVHFFLPLQNKLSSANYHYSSIKSKRFLLFIHTTQYVKLLTNYHYLSVS